MYLGAPSWIAVNPDRNVRIGADSASYAAYMLEKIVSPPLGGMTFRFRIDPIGGSGSQDTSECQRSPAMRLEFASAWTGRISGWPSGPLVLGWTASSPNSRPNALC